MCDYISEPEYTQEEYEQVMAEIALDMGPVVEFPTQEQIEDDARRHHDCEIPF